ncbi:MAG: phosphate ABC transporter permease subunit PstC [Actinomycetota bacterium]|nr:phosphate ABC transporter permease subunit PstC [Actinomycetota bacterium]
MSVTARLRGRPRARKPGGRRGIGDGVLFGFCAVAGLITVVVIAEVIYQVISGAAPAISRFGLGFVWHSTWQPNFLRFGAGEMLFGTLVTALIALVLATPLGIAIGLFLSMLAPRGVRTVIGPLVEMLAAIPSVVLGLWGVIVLAPFVQRTFEPWLHSAFGFIPIFGPPETTGLSVFTAGLVLTIMVVPIVASLSRDLFLSVPRELQEGAAALGATRWEIIRGVILPTTSSGVIAAALLGLGRALGEAVAVAAVIGGGSTIHASVFEPGNTFAARIINEIPTPDNDLHIHSLFYGALILLVIGVLTNLLAQGIASRLGTQEMLAR